MTVRKRPHFPPKSCGIYWNIPFKTGVRVVRAYIRGRITTNILWYISKFVRQSEPTPPPQQACYFSN